MNNFKSLITIEYYHNLPKLKRFYRHDDTSVLAEDGCSFWVTGEVQ